MRAAYWFLERDWADIMLLSGLSIAGLVARIAFVPPSGLRAESAIAVTQFVTVVAIWLGAIRLRQTTQ